MSVIPSIWVPYPQPASSVELRCGILYSGCQCLKRNGLQQDCPRSACQGRARCMEQPTPTCAPSGGYMLSPPPNTHPSYDMRRGDVETPRSKLEVEESRHDKRLLNERLRDMARQGNVEHLLVKAWDNNPCKVHRATRDIHGERRQHKKKD